MPAVHESEIVPKETPEVEIKEEKNTDPDTDCYRVEVFTQLRTVSELDVLDAIKYLEQSKPKKQKQNVSH